LLYSVSTCHPYLVPLVVRAGGGIHGPANVLGVGQGTRTQGRLPADLCRILDLKRPDDLHCGFRHSQSIFDKEQLD